jgi:hypothetical protein
MKELIDNLKISKDVVQILIGYLFVTILIWLIFGWNDVVFVLLLGISWIPVYYFVEISIFIGTWIGKFLKNK